MTNSEAIRIINQYDCNFYWTDGEKIPTEDLIEAFEFAVKALDSTEPRVLTLEEVGQIMTVWGEINGHGFETMPLLLDRIEDSKVRFVSRDVGWYLEADKRDYAKRWRCWSAKPTDEQRRVVPWTE